MELVKTYDNVGNISDETYTELSNGVLVETSQKVGKETAQDCCLGRVYFEIAE